ncbi:MAG: hypothetical protein ACO23N_05905 [Opitutales bacterium]
MTLPGFLFMTVSVGCVVTLFSWCLWKVLTTPRKPEHLAHVEPVERKDLAGR